MKVLCIGDVVSRVGRDMLFRYIEDIQYKYSIDFIIANGENAAHGNGIGQNEYDELMNAGVDVVTMGNHTWGHFRQISQMMENGASIVRPLNYSGMVPGEGASIFTAKNGKKVGVINLIGRTFMHMPADSPFVMGMNKIEELRKTTNIIFVDFHAEATSEKEALGYYFDGLVSAVFGTHTHVQTADDMVLPKGTGYISDLGMTGPIISVLGIDKDNIIERFVNGMPNKSLVAKGKGQFCACIFTIDDETGLCTGTERLYIREKN